MTAQMGQIVAYVESLAELDTDDVEPMAHALDVANVFAADELRPSLDRGRRPGQRSPSRSRVLPGSRRAGRVSHVPACATPPPNCWPNLNAGQTTSVELTQAYLDQIKQHDPQVKAFLRVDAAKALARAAEIDAPPQGRQAAGPAGRPAGGRQGPALHRRASRRPAARGCWRTSGRPTTPRSSPG